MSIYAHLRHWTDIRSRARDYFGYHSRLMWTVLYPNKREASSGLWGLDRQIIDLFQNKKNGYYIELGANNGFTQSNSLWLEMFYGWTGTLIEPVESTYLECVKNRSSRRNAIFRAACVSDSYSEKTVNLSVFDRDMFTRLWASPLGVESTVKNPLLHGRANSKEKENKDYRIEQAPARTLTSILLEAGAPRKIDFMSLDVEGGEIEVLKGLDSSRYLIEWICVETQNYEAVDELLRARGYQLHSRLTHHDYMFVLPDGLSR